MTTPTKEDVSKLHAEINIYINQRWTLLVTSISIVGAVLAWITQKISPADVFSAGLLFVGAALLLYFLALIAAIDTSLEVNEQGPAAFLRLTGASPYELALARRNSGNRLRLLGIGGKRVVYATLGMFVAAWPFVVAPVSVLSIPRWQAGLHLLAIATFYALVFCLLPRWAARRRMEIDTAWKAILPGPANDA